MADEKAKMPSKMYAMTDIITGREEGGKDKLIKRGSSVSQSDVGKESFEQMVASGAIRDTEPGEPGSVFPNVAGVLPVAEREGDAALKTEDTEDVTNIEEVYAKANEKMGVTPNALPSKPLG